MEKLSEPHSGSKSRIDWDQVREKLKSNQEAMEQLFSSGEEKNKLVFAERAERMAARLRNNRLVDTLTVMTFQLGKERYALPLSDLAEILPFADCTPIPGCPPELSGVISIRGEIRCVIDLAMVLGLEVDIDEENAGYILLLRNETHELGLRVSHVHQVETIDKKSLSNQDIGTAAMIGQYVKAVGDGSLIFLNLSTVLGHSVFKGIA
jgi:purine-binding chemotaxis protein CheW